MNRNFTNLLTAVDTLTWLIWVVFSTNRSSSIALEHPRIWEFKALLESKDDERLRARRAVVASQGVGRTEEGQAARQDGPDKKTAQVNVSTTSASWEELTRGQCPDRLDRVRKTSGIYVGYRYQHRINHCPVCLSGAGIRSCAEDVVHGNFNGRCFESTENY